MGEIASRDDVRIDGEGAQSGLTAAALAVVTRLVAAVCVRPGTQAMDKAKVQALRYLLMDVDRAVARMRPLVRDDIDSASGLRLQAALCEWISRSWERSGDTECEVSEQIDAVARVVRVDDPQGALARALVDLGVANGAEGVGSGEASYDRAVRQAAWLLYDAVTNPALYDRFGVCFLYERTPVQLVEVLLPVAIEVAAFSFKGRGQAGALIRCDRVVQAATLLGAEYVAHTAALRSEIVGLATEERSERLSQVCGQLSSKVVEPCRQRAQDSLLAIEDLVSMLSAQALRGEGK